MRARRAEGCDERGDLGTEGGRQWDGWGGGGGGRGGGGGVVLEYGTGLGGQGFLELVVEGAVGLFRERRTGLDGREVELLAEAVGGEEEGGGQLAGCGACMRGGEEEEKKKEEEEEGGVPVAGNVGADVLARDFLLGLEARDAGL